MLIAAYRKASDSLSRGSHLITAAIRLVVGVLFIDHGLQKYHEKGGLTSFEYFLRSLKNAPAPGLTSHVIPGLEVVGGAMLIAGLLTRVIALVLAAEMVFTGFVVKLHDLHTGVVAALGAGAELDLVYLLVLLTVLLLGPGRASIDHLLRVENMSGQATATSPLAATPERLSH